MYICVDELLVPRRETLLKRLEGRSSRQGDERLGLSDTTDDKGRIEAYLQRAADEDSKSAQNWVTVPNAANGISLYVVCDYAGWIRR